MFFNNKNLFQNRFLLPLEWTSFREIRDLFGTRKRVTDPDMLKILLDQKGLETKALSMAEAIQVNKRWLNIFARKTKESTGKWRIGGHLWEGFGKDLQPAITNAKAMEVYKQKSIESFYVFDETGKHCFLCNADQYPEFYNSGLDLYVFPISESWTAVFTHGNAVYFPRILNKS